MVVILLNCTPRNLAALVLAPTNSEQDDQCSDDCCSSDRTAHGGSSLRPVHISGLSIMIIESWSYLACPLEGEAADETLDVTTNGAEEDVVDGTACASVLLTTA